MPASGREDRVPIEVEVDQLSVPGEKRGAKDNRSAPQSPGAVRGLPRAFAGVHSNVVLSAATGSLHLPGAFDAQHPAQLATSLRASPATVRPARLAVPERRVAVRDRPVRLRPRAW